MSTIYSEVTADDTDVAVFVAAHFVSVNLLHLPSKMWVARQDGAIVALLTLTTQPYLALDLIVADPKARPFMRIFRLWRMAETWLRSIGAPIVCITINNARVHFQSLVRRLGYEKIGDEFDADGDPIETIFARTWAVQ